MTDELLPPDRTLASAALDNEVTAHERATVEASPGLLAEREVYADVQAQLRDVDVPRGARDSALAAALAAFDTPQTPANVVSLAARRARRERMRGWLTGVAAAAVIGVVGVAVVNGRGQDNEDSASSATLAASIATTAAATESANDSAEKSPAYDNGVGGAADTTIVAFESAETAGADAPAAAPIDSRPVFDSPDQIADFYGSGADGDASASTAAADTTLADSAPTETSAAPPASAAPAETEAASTQIAACAADPTLGDIAAIYRGEPVILRFRMDGDRRVVDVIPEATCVVAETIPLG